MTVRRALLMLIPVLSLVLSLTAITPAHAATWKWCSSDSEGTWQPGFGRWFVRNEAWAGDHGPQRICAHSVTSWTAWSDQKAGNTAVETAPNSMKSFGTIAGLPRDPYSSFRRITGTFSESMPHGRGVSAEFAFETWWGNGWDTDTEMMIWTSTVNRSMAGSTYLGRTHIYGQLFRVYRYDGSPPEFVFRLDHNESHGKVHILSAARWLVRHGYMRASSALTAIEPGFEICSTGGVTRAFTLNRASLQVAGGSG